MAEQLCSLALELVIVSGNEREKSSSDPSWPHFSPFALSFGFHRNSCGYRRLQSPHKMAYRCSFPIKISKQPKCGLMGNCLTVKRGLMVLPMRRARLSHVSPRSCLLCFSGGEPASWGGQRGASGGAGCRRSQNPKVLFICGELSGAPRPGHRRQSSGDREGDLASS